VAASHTFAPDPRFPVGTVLSVYAGEHRRFQPGTAAVTTGMIGADRTVTFTGLTYDTRYTAGATIDGRWLTTLFTTLANDDYASRLDILEERLGREPVNVMSSVGASAGAAGDGVTNDTAAIEAHLAAAGAGAVLLFPPGYTFLVEDLDVGALSGVTFIGYGATLKRKLNGTVPENTYIADVNDCENFRCYGLAFDFNGIERFGGFNFDGCDGVWIEDCHFYDGALNASWSSFDHYALVIQDCTDVHVTGCRSEDIEFIEVNNCERVRIAENVIHGAAGTAAIGMFAVGNGYTFVNYEIVDNIIIDPRKRGILFQHETGGPDNVTVRNVRIARNYVAHLTATSDAGSRMIDFTTAAATGTGNTLEGVEVVDNVCYAAAALVVRTVAHMRVRHVSGNVWDGMRVARNTVHANTTDWAMDLRSITNGEIEDNRVDGTATSGIQFHTFTGCSIKGNRAEASANAFGLISSGGSNVVADNRAIGSPTAVWHTSSAAAAGDIIEPTAGHKSIVSAATITLPLDAGNVVTVTAPGSTNVTAITATGRAGHVITFIWGTGTTIDVADGSNIKLASGATTLDADDTLTLACDGTSWFEVARSVN
jgi:hypothetical protein